MSEPLPGIVIGHADLGDSDRIIRLLTAEQGRVDVLARGARSSRKRFGGALDLGTRVKVLLGPSRSSLRRLEEVELVKAVDRARTDFDRLSLLAYGCELVGRLAGADQAEPKLARLLVVWLELLEGEALPGGASRVALEAKALTFAGLLPSLVQCSVCDEPLGDPCYWSHDNGVVHGHCGGGEGVTAALLQQIEDLRRLPLFDSPGEHDPGTWLLAEHVQYHTRAALKSRSMFV